MKILIYGDGNIGISLAANFAAGDNDVVVIAENREKLQSLADTLDIQIVLGKACYPSLLEEVNAGSADVFIAADGVYSKVRSELFSNVSFCCCNKIC